MITGGACPWVEGNLFRDGLGAGVLVTMKATGVLRGNEFRGHAKTELQITDAGTHPLVERNVIHSSRAGGILIFGGSSGLIRHNTVHSNVAANVRLAESSTARIVVMDTRWPRECLPAH